MILNDVFPPLQQRLQLRDVYVPPVTFGYTKLHFCEKKNQHKTIKGRRQCCFLCLCATGCCCYPCWLLHTQKITKKIRHLQMCKAKGHKRKPLVKIRHHFTSLRQHRIYCCPDLFWLPPFLLRMPSEASRGAIYSVPTLAAVRLFSLVASPSSSGSSWRQTPTSV